MGARTPCGQELVVGSGELRQEVMRVVEPPDFGVEAARPASWRAAGELRRTAVRAEGVFAEGSPLEHQRSELHAEDGGGVGLAAGGADAERFGGSGFGLVGVPGERRAGPASWLAAS